MIDFSFFPARSVQSTIYALYNYNSCLSFRKTSSDRMNRPPLPHQLHRNNMANNTAFKPQHYLNYTIFFRQKNDR